MQKLSKPLKNLFLIKLFWIFLSLQLLSCKEQTANAQNNKVMTDKDWKEKLSDEEYYILREKGTERPFTGKYNDFFEKGYYVCAACGNKLFESTTKYNSSCGWPSFDEAIEGSVKYTKDTSHGMVRVEVTCAKCDGHLGHVFEDGPKDTTGNRYCMNSISLKFIPEN
ncbi:peptide-methionine (R)-S-oxide reductase MsrB [Flavobacterium sp. xlx-214]|nr:peptide-methionine (R)-S-oxide reductase MsrB [Flavobacterium sp. xlx-221]QMI82553.1 peptide-methionine (R)-S-oxide reductase MsrB [Flavobacterium sp. xlx-214]